MSLPRFQAELNQWADQNLKRKPLEFQKAVCIEAVIQLVRQTPVGNEKNWAMNKGRVEAGKKLLRRAGYVGGHMRRNWQASVGVPLRQELAGVDALGERTKNEMFQVVAGLAEPTLFWFANPVPYAEVVEFGSGSKKPWSIQAPDGVVTPTLKNLETKFRKVL